jgi:catechol 2,3-dioxygenase-like lactoylglutathione lyase family enzyme
MITGINHITLSICDVEDSFRFYTEILGFRAVARWPQGVYLLAGDLWVALMLDPNRRQQELPEYTHIAFTVSIDHFPAMEQRIKGANVPIWQENRTEGESIYFLDPSGHKLEIHASNLANRLKSAAKNPWAGLEIL